MIVAERERIVGAGVEEHRSHGARSGERRGEADDQAEPDEFSALRQNEAEHITLLRAERHANAEFARALHNVVSHHAVNPDRGDDERDERKNGQERHRETLARDAVGHDFFQRANGADGLVLVHGINGRTQSAEQRGGRTARANDDVQEPERHLRERLVRLALVALSTPYCLMSPTMPTISRQVSGPFVMLIRLPIGSSFGKCWRAMVSLMMATRGALASSCG